jgi:hypothetical protein
MKYINFLVNNKNCEEKCKVVLFLANFNPFFNNIISNIFKEHTKNMSYEKNLEYKIYLEKFQFFI